MGECLYTEIWRRLSNAIIEAIKKGESGSCYLPSEWFTSVGNRKSYSFRSEFEDGYCLSDLGGTAVGRDLRDVMLASAEFREACKGKFVVIRMGKNFDLHIEVREKRC